MSENAPAGQRTSIAILVDAGTNPDDHARFLNALLDLCKTPALGTQTKEKIAALKYVLAIEEANL